MRRLPWLPCYFKIRAGELDGIGRVHLYLYGECPRCGKEIHYGSLRLPDMELFPRSANGVIDLVAARQMINKNHDVGVRCLKNMTIKQGRDLWVYGGCHKGDMQTYLPLANFHRTARVLDSKRLGNQVYRECLTIIRGHWPNHPASRMWRGYSSALARYAIALLEELRDRGRYYPHHFETFRAYIVDDRMPPWLGDERVHSAYRSALLMKNPVYYGQFGWTDGPFVDYYWPRPG